MRVHPSGQADTSAAAEHRQNGADGVAAPDPPTHITLCHPPTTATATNPPPPPPPPPHPTPPHNHHHHHPTHTHTPTHHDVLAHLSKCRMLAAPHLVCTTHRPWMLKHPRPPPAHPDVLAQRFLQLLFQRTRARGRRPRRSRSRAQPAQQAAEHVAANRRAACRAGVAFSLACRAHRRQAVRRKLRRKTGNSNTLAGAVFATLPAGLSQLSQRPPCQSRHRPSRQDASFDLGPTPSPAACWWRPFDAMQQPPG